MKHIDINKIRRAMALVAVMIVTMASAMAQTAVNYIDKDGIEQTCETYIEVGTTITAWNAGWYLVNGEVVISGGVTVTGAVHLILADGASLTVTGAAGKAGVNVSGTANSLTVYGQAEGTGKLTANGTGYANGTGGGAGIGGNDMQSGGNITVNGGIVTANGGGGGAGIGGGCDGSAYNIEINRGTVTANGSLLSTGIGVGAVTKVEKPNTTTTLTFSMVDNTVTKLLGVEWKEGDVVKVYDGETQVGELKYRNHEDTIAIFRGNIVIPAKSATMLTFRRGTTSSFTEQDGTLATLKTNYSLEGTAEYNAAGNYIMNMSVPYALMKLDLSALGTTDGTTVTISAGGSTVASVNSVKNTSTELYVAIPANGVKTAYTFEGNGFSTVIDLTLQPNTFYSSNGNPMTIAPYLCFTAKQDNSTVAMAKYEPMGDQAPAVNLEYSINGNAWNTFTVGTTTVTLNNEGDKVYFRANGVNKAFGGPGKNGPECHNYFVTTGDLSVGGNIMYLLNGTDPKTEMTSDNKYCFYGLFKNCAVISDASELLLPATTLADYCYGFMFYGCSKLNAAPELPATTLATRCYGYMFKGSKINAAPELPATTLAEECYESMFKDCTNLTAAPELKATTLAQYCYYFMFYGCSKLSSVTMLATNVSAGYCLYNWLKDAGTSASNPNLYVADGMVNNKTIKDTQNTPDYWNRSVYNPTPGK